MVTGFLLLWCKTCPPVRKTKYGPTGGHRGQAPENRFWLPLDSAAATAVAERPPLHFARLHAAAKPCQAYRRKANPRLAPSTIFSALRLLSSCAASHVSRMLSKTPGQHRIRQSCFPTSSATGKCMTKTATAMTPQAATGFTPQTALVTHSLRGAHLPLQALAQCSAQMVR